MRALIGIIGLVIVVAIIGVVAKKQLASVAVPTAQPQGTAAVTPKQQMDQLKQGLESTLQQPRTTSEEGK